MITHLKGNIETINESSLVLDVNGVGYQLLCSSRTLESVSRCRDMVHLYTVMSVREDGWILYGFADERERSWFNMLISVQGVGGKVALAILSALSPEDIYSAFCSGDKTMLTRADGAAFARGEAGALREAAARIIAAQFYFLSSSGGRGFIFSPSANSRCGPSALS